MIEYLEDVMNDPNFSPKFVRELKRDAKNYIHSSEKLIDALSASNNMNIAEQIAGLYVVVSNLVENNIDWDSSGETKE